LAPTLFPLKPLILTPVNPPRRGGVAIAIEEGMVGTAIGGVCGVAQRGIGVVGGMRQ